MAQTGAGRSERNITAALPRGSPGGSCCMKGSPKSLSGPAVCCCLAFEAKLRDASNRKSNTIPKAAWRPQPNSVLPARGGLCPRAAKTEYSSWERQPGF